MLLIPGAESELTAAKQNAEQYQLAAQANEEALRDLNLVSWVVEPLDDMC